MHIDVAKAIKELLYQSDSVIIPGLGGLITTPAAASVDYVQGVVDPPSKKLEFNENLVVNDGALARYIEEKYTVSFREAVEAISAFVKEAKATLERREIVEIPGVGRLYQDYQQQIRFMPDKTNFAVDSFGLPGVNFRPVTREREAVPTAAGSGATATPKVTTDTQASASEASPSFFKRYLPWLVGAGALLTAVLIFLVFSGGGSDIKVPDTDRLNVSPKSTQKGQQQADDATAGVHGESPEATPGQEGNSPTENGAAGTPSAEPGEEAEQPPVAERKEAFIVVHSFKNPRNANNFYNVLSEAGYRAEKRLWNGLQRVGIIFPYRYPAEIDSIKAVLGPKYKSGPKLFEELEK